VEGGELDRHPGDLYGLELRERHQVARAAHVPGHAHELRRRRHRGELPGDGPTRLAPHHAELALEGEVVDLHDDPVDLVVEPVAAFLPGAAGLADLVEGVVTLHVRVDLEAVAAQPFERVVMGLEPDPLDRPDAVAPDRQRPRGGDARVELADRARRRVARVGVDGLAGVGTLLVELGEPTQREEHLAADLQQRGRVLHA
jgi:hypothetical protein